MIPPVTSGSCNGSSSVLSMCFGSLRLRCHGATAKSLADELGMEPGDLLLTDAATGESVVIPEKQRDSLAAMIERRS